MDLSLVADPCAMDTDNDGTPDCLDNCPNDPNKVEPGTCGCGVPDTAPDGDMNLDGVVDGLDIQRFEEALVSGAPTQAEVCHGDFDGLNGVDTGDVPAMVNALLNAP
jgi:hypothetical protein